MSLILTRTNMQLLLKSDQDLHLIADSIYGWDKPDSYPCLAVGSWQTQDCGPDGWDYEFVYLTETPYGYIVDGL